jgi:hypothetical protein
MALLVRCSACSAEFRAQAKFRGNTAPCPKCHQPLTIDGPPIADYDVFISYSSSDKQAADAVCAALEAKRWRCWIAPRDVMAGREWGGAIVEAIEQSRLMVLVYSSHANQSQQVIREVERAVNKGVPIIPFRIEAAPPSKNMEYFLGASHWLDAYTQPLERHIEELANAIRALLKLHTEMRGREESRQASAATVVTPALAPGRTAAISPAHESIPPSPPARKSVAWIAVAGMLIVAIAAIAMIKHGQPREPGPVSFAPPASAPASAPSTQTAGITQRVILVPRQSFLLKHGHREQLYPITIPTIAAGKGWLQITVGDMGDNSGDMGMHVVLLDSKGNMVMRKFGKNTDMFTYEVAGGTSWTVVLRDMDSARDGNGGTVEIAVAPK